MLSMKTFYLLSLYIVSTTFPLTAVEPDYSAWNSLLKKYVRPGNRSGISANLVDYRGIKADALFPVAVKTLSEFNPLRLANRNEKLAFYINLYNIAAIRKVLEKYPTASIRASGDGVWKEEAIELAGKKYSLDAIEHQVLRPLGDARMHFAIVCASLSCPDLRNEAYTAHKLNAQLDQQTRAFLGNTTKGLRIEKDKIHQSAIFNWFKEDFKDVRGFQNRYVKTPPGPVELIEIPYNWQLNE